MGAALSWSHPIRTAEFDEACQYCDNRLSSRARSINAWFCIDCADELRDDDDYWGRLVRANEHQTGVKQIKQPWELAA